jgi:hypothetical protein
MIKDALSGIGHLHAGVPQGSVLGPLIISANVTLVTCFASNASNIL